MAWTPIYSSGIDYQFDPSGTFSAATLGVDSIVKGVNVGGALGHWELTLEGAASLRVTTLSYSDNSISDPAFFTWEPGSVAVVNQDQSELPTSFLPSPFTIGPATSLRFDFGYYEQAGSFEFLIEVQTDTPEPPAACDEIGSVSRAFVSAHDRLRVHNIQVPPGERRCVVADYNGALPVGRSIVAVEWRLSHGGVGAISAAAIPTTRQAQVQLQAGSPGRVALRCAATLDNGEVYMQRFMVEVPCMPSFGDEAVTTGPTTLTAVAS